MRKEYGWINNELLNIVYAMYTILTFFRRKLFFPSMSSEVMKKKSWSDFSKKIMYAKKSRFFLDFRFFDFFNCFRLFRFFSICSTFFNLFRLFSTFFEIFEFSTFFNCFQMFSTVFNFFPLFSLFFNFFRFHSVQHSNYMLVFI